MWLYLHFNSYCSTQSTKILTTLSIFCHHFDDVLLTVNSIIPILAILASDGKVIMVDAKIHKKKSSKPAYSLDDLVPPTVDNPKDLNVKLFLSGIMSNLCNPPFLLRMCPPLTTKNWPEYKPLMASGGSNGNIQILNMSSGRVEREFATHTFPVCICNIKGSPENSGQINHKFGLG